MYPFMLGGTDPNTAMLWVLAGFLGWFFLAILIGWAINYWDEVKDWWDCILGPPLYKDVSYNRGNTTVYKNTTTYTAPKAKKTTNQYGLYDHERHNPPKALFFCREEGKERSIEGPWEEVHLSSIEKTAWENKKRKNEVISTEYNTKSPILDESKAFLEQNDEFKGYRG